MPTSLKLRDCNLKRWDANVHDMLETDNSMSNSSSEYETFRKRRRKAQSISCACTYACPINGKPPYGSQHDTSNSDVQAPSGSVQRQAPPGAHTPDKTPERTVSEHLHNDFSALVRELDLAKEQQTTREMENYRLRSQVQNEQRENLALHKRLQTQEAELFYYKLADNKATYDPDDPSSSMPSTMDWSATTRAGDLQASRSVSQKLPQPTALGPKDSQAIKAPRIATNAHGSHGPGSIRQICLHFLRGHCQYGIECRRLHIQNFGQVEDIRSNVAVRINHKMRKQAQFQLHYGHHCHGSPGLHGPVHLANSVQQHQRCKPEFANPMIQNPFGGGVRIGEATHPGPAEDSMLHEDSRTKSKVAQMSPSDFEDWLGRFEFPHGAQHTLERLDRFFEACEDEMGANPHQHLAFLQATLRERLLHETPMPDTAAIANRHPSPSLEVAYLKARLRSAVAR